MRETGNTQWTNIKAAEVILYGSALSDTERQQIERNQGTIYGISGLSETDPSFPVNINGVTRSAVYLSGTGTSAHTYRYTIQAGEVDNDGIVISSPISGGTNKDSVGVDANLTFTTPSGVGVLIDTTTPSTISGYPLANTATLTTIQVKDMIDEAGTAYYVVLPNGGTTPTSLEVQNATAAGAVTSGSFALTANTECTGTAIGLTAGTQYDVYVVAKDTAGNLQASPTKVDAATYAGGDGTRSAMASEMARKI